MPALVALLQTTLVWVGRYLFAKILLAFGVSIISVGSYMYILNQIKDWVSASFAAMPSAIYNLLLIAGVGNAVGYIFGAYAFVMTTSFLNRIAFGVDK